MNFFSRTADKERKTPEPADRTLLFCLLTSEQVNRWTNCGKGCTHCQTHFPLHNLKRFAAAGSRGHVRSWGLRGTKNKQTNKKVFCRSEDVGLHVDKNDENILEALIKASQASTTDTQMAGHTHAGGIDRDEHQTHESGGDQGGSGGGTRRLQLSRCNQAAQPHAWRHLPFKPHIKTQVGQRTTHNIQIIASTPP